MAFIVLRRNRTARHRRPFGRCQQNPAASGSASCKLVWVLLLLSCGSAIHSSNVWQAGQFSGNEEMETEPDAKKICFIAPPLAAVIHNAK